MQVESESCHFRCDKVSKGEAPGLRPAAKLVGPGGAGGEGVGGGLTLASSPTLAPISSANLLGRHSPAPRGFARADQTPGKWPRRRAPRRRE
jgi:hypothetical protein